ncbi:MAG: hypothetical protein LBV45_01800 [Xanthomonadaceae bacterium]|nr:hypothetical protein [Xanthomonadaceae bacterium]
MRYTCKSTVFLNISGAAAAVRGPVRLSLFEIGQEPALQAAAFEIAAQARVGTDGDIAAVDYGARMLPALCRIVVDLYRSMM